MLGLFEAFSLKCTQLKQAVACGHDDLVRLLDKELEPLIDDILALRARNHEEAHKQLHFLNGLIRDEAEDKSSVIRRSAAMSMLIDRYFPTAGEGADGFPGSVFRRAEKPAIFEAVEQPLFNEAILDALPDRVGVITKDYRYLYSNHANAQFLNRTPLSMIGSHVAEFIGEDGFRSMAKPNFDTCFRGDKVDYVHRGIRNAKKFATRCRMSPLRSVGNEVIGAVIVLQNVDETLALELR